MATLKNTTIPTLDVVGDVTASGEIQTATNNVHGHYRSTASNSYTTVGFIPFSTVQLGDRITLTTSGNGDRFTVADDGIYVACWVNISNSANLLTRVNLYVNGAVYKQARSENTSAYPNHQFFEIVNLSAGDYVEVYLNAGQVYLNAAYAGFTLYKAA